MTADRLTIKGVLGLGPCRSYTREKVALLFKQAAKPTLLAACDLCESSLPTKDLTWLAVMVLKPPKGVMFATSCAEHVLPKWEAHHPEDNRPRVAIRAARGSDPTISLSAMVGAAIAAAERRPINGESDHYSYAALAVAWAAYANAAYHFHMLSHENMSVTAIGHAVKTGYPYRELAWQRSHLKACLAGEMGWEESVL